MEKQTTLSPLERVSLRNPTHFFALGFGSGLLSTAPGTWGTLVGLITGVILLQWFSASFFFLFLCIMFAWGCYLCERTAQDMQVHDHGAIVWDEIVGIWLVLLAVPHYSITWCLTAFLLFRLFDIFKPKPIKHFDQTVTNGFGIMLDDFLAALYSILTIALLRILLL